MVRELDFTKDEVDLEFLLDYIRLVHRMFPPVFEGDINTPVKRTVDLGHGSTYNIPNSQGKGANR